MTRVFCCFAEVWRVCAFRSFLAGAQLALVLCYCILVILYRIEVYCVPQWLAARRLYLCLASISQRCFRPPLDLHCRADASSLSPCVHDVGVLCWDVLCGWRNDVLAMPGRKCLQWHCLHHVCGGHVRVGWLLAVHTVCCRVCVNSWRSCVQVCDRPSLLTMSAGCVTALRSVVPQLLCIR